MLGCKRFRNAEVRISGIELVYQIRKGQIETSKEVHSGVQATQLWGSVIGVSSNPGLASAPPVSTICTRIAARLFQIAA
jgi:hypothetical protein